MMGRCGSMSPDEKVGSKCRNVGPNDGKVGSNDGYVRS